MRSRTGVAAVLIWVISGCGGDGASLQRFTERLEDGADCSELFAIRNEFDPHADEIDEMNVKLREVGCYNSTSERTN